MLKHTLTSPEQAGLRHTLLRIGTTRLMAARMGLPRAVPEQRDGWIA